MAMRLLISALLTVLLSSGARPQGTPPPAPAIPREAAAAERAALLQAENSLSRGQFEQAALQLKPLLPPATVQVFVDWAPVPTAVRPAYQQAAREALQAWNRGLAGTLQFQLSDREDADLRLLFERSVAQVRAGVATLVCIETTLDGPPAPRRAGQARLSLTVPYSDEPHAPSSMAHLFGQALGSYLGLGSSTDAADLMGPDNHGSPASSAPSAGDLRLARELQQARVALADLASRRAAVYLARAALAVEKTEIDAGEVERGDSAHYVFALRNTGDAPLEVEARPTCGCTVARYDKVIGPGAEGKVEAELHTSGYRGPIAKVSEVHTNDPDHPQTSLRLLANVVSLVQVLPAETSVVPLKSAGPTVREIEIRTSGKEPVTVTRVVTSSPYAQATLTPQPAQSGAGRAYRLTLTVGAEAPNGRTVVVVTAYTDSPKEPQVNITAICDKGILTVPMTLYLGSIGAGTTLPLTQIVTLSKADGSFHVRRATSDDPKLTVEPQTVQDGSQYRLKVVYAGGWAAGAVRSRITVETDDPQQPKVEIPVLANVQAATAAR